MLHQDPLNDDYDVTAMAHWENCANGAMPEAKSCLRRSRESERGGEERGKDKVAELIQTEIFAVSELRNDVNEWPKVWNQSGR